METDFPFMGLIAKNDGVIAFRYEIFFLAEKTLNLRS